MELSMQAKILKAIEEQQARRIGSSKNTHFHTRIICAMNQNPADVLHAGLMRTDLFYRICVVRIDIPPLRDRKPDVMILTDYFINYFNRKMKKSIRGVSALVKMTFQKYNWKGNVRELRNTLEYAFNLCQGSIINMGDLPDMLQENHKTNHLLPEAEPKLSSIREEAAADIEQVEVFPYDESLSLTENTAAYEKEAISRILEKTDSITEAAKILRVSRQTLSYKIEKYRLD